MSSPLPARSAFVDLWWFRVDGGPDPAPLLSGGERERADRFASRALARRWAAARAGLRAVLAGYVEVPPDQLRFEVGHRGKPTLAGAGDLRFNLAHGGEVAVVGVARGREVGVDVEALDRRMGRPETIARRFFSPAEQEAVLGLEGAELARRFLTLWTRKEAVLKLTGEGLALPLASVEVGWPGPESPAPVRVVDTSGTLRWARVVDTTVAGGYLAAVAAEGEGWALRARPWVGSPRPRAGSGSGAG